MRHLRKILAAGLPILGTVIVFSALLVPSISFTLRLQVFVALLGLLLIFSGVWRLTARVLPNERKYLILRREVENFLGLIRTLNAQAVRLGREETETAKDHYRETIDALHTAVDRMAEVAGREG